MIIMYEDIKIASEQEKKEYLMRKFINSSDCMKTSLETFENYSLEKELPPVEEAKKLPILSTAQEKLLEKRKACALNLVSRYFILDENEKVEEDFFSFLLSDWKGIKKGTPVLRRKTNISTVYFFFEHNTVDLSCNKVESLPENPILSSHENIFNNEMFSPGDIKLKNPLASIALSVAGAIAGKFATMAIDKIMGTSIPSYFDEVYEQVSSIVSQELDKHMIKEITDEFTAKQNWIVNHYIPLKNRTVDPPTLKRLEKELNDAQTEFYCYLAKLMNEKVSLSCLKEFLIGANIHLALLQELILVTDQSNYKEEFVLNITKYIQHAEDTWNKISNTRRNKIITYKEKYCETLDVGVVKCTFYWVASDEVSGLSRRYKYEKEENKARASAESTANIMRANAINNLSELIGQPAEVVNCWKKAKELYL